MLNHLWYTAHNKIQSNCISWLTVFPWLVCAYDWTEFSTEKWNTSHTCHITHCEIKSHRIWPIWKPIPIRFFKSHRIFRPSYNILWRNKHKSHFVVFITVFLHLNKSFWPFWGSYKVIFVKITENFIKSPVKICLTSQISVHSLWHGCIT